MNLDCYSAIQFGCICSKSQKSIFLNIYETAQIEPLWFFFLFLLNRQPKAKQQKLKKKIKARQDKQCHSFCS